MSEKPTETTTTESAQPLPVDEESCYVPTRRVVVKLIDEVRVPFRAGVERCLFESDHDWRQIASRFPGLSFEPVFASVGSERLGQLIERAAEITPAYRPPRFENFLFVDPGKDASAHEVAQALRELPTVEQAIVEGRHRVMDMPDTSDDALWAMQTYLDSAPTGIDAEFAWGLGGGAGAGIQVSDVEFAWTLHHEDLLAASVSFVSGIQHPMLLAAAHGTSVLGILLAVDNDRGCVGIAPECRGRVAGAFSNPNMVNIAAAIADAAAASSYGDAILIELATSLGGSSGYVPVEVMPAELAAIQLAVAAGVSVVECAGNSAVDLDNYQHSMLAGRIFNPQDPAFQDSGAIIVGASTGAPPHPRVSFSNYGTRVDCYAHGAFVTAPGANLQFGHDTTAYRSTFNGTSAAGAIVAGAVAVLQGVLGHHGSLAWSPAQMRSVLRNPSLNTPSNNPSSDRIGPMPNLRKIVADGMGIYPDVFVRDFVGDVGLPHNNGGMWASPDVIVRPTPVPNPQAAFGQGSGTLNSNTLGSEVEFGQDNYIYVRVASRGTLTLHGVQASVWFAPASTLALPSAWTFVGTTTIPEVHYNGNMVVSHAIVWDQANIPAPGHYCFVCVLDHPADPSPSPTSITTWQDFVDFVRNNNNVAWRNFSVVNLVPPQAPGGVVVEELPFGIAGAPDLRLPFVLEVDARLPPDAKVELVAPRSLADALADGGPKPRDAQGRVKLPALSLGSHRFPALELPAGFEAECALRVALPGKRLDRAYSIAVRQLQGDLEVGRVTWTLQPEKPIEPGDPVPANPSAAVHPRRRRASQRYGRGE